MFWVKLIKTSITLAYPHFAVLGKGYLYCGLTGNFFPMADAPLDESSQYLIQRVTIFGQDIFRDNGEFINQHIPSDKAIGLHNGRIVLHHLALDVAGVGMGLVFFLINLWAIWENRGKYAPILR